MKLFGISILSLIPICLGYWRKKKLLRQQKMREDLIEFFTFLRFEIQHFLRPQEEIFAQFQSPILEETNFLPTLRYESLISHCGAMERSIAMLMQEEHFSPREETVLTDFGKRFGLRSKQGQLEDCDALLEALKEAEKNEGKKCAADAAAAWTSGVCIGMGIFILLI